MEIKNSLQSIIDIAEDNVTFENGVWRDVLFFARDAMNELTAIEENFKSLSERLGELDNVLH
jgi:hypothetical protein